jgi:hypothetical protein
LHIFREKDTTTRLLGGSHNQGIPEGKSMKEVKVDGGQNIVYARSGNVEFGEQFDLPARDAWIHAQLSRNGNEIFLEDLEGNHACPFASVLGDELKGALPLCRSGLIVGINENVSIKKTTSGHESHPD